MSFWWPMVLVVAASIAYQVCAKEVPVGADALAVLIVTYLVASAASFLIWFILAEKGKKTKGLWRVSSEALGVGISIVCMEVGVIGMYQVGWSMNAAFLVYNSLIVLALLAVGAVVYGEKIPREKLAGVIISAAGVACIMW